MNKTRQFPRFVPLAVWLSGIFVISFLLSSPGLAQVQIGDDVPNLCWVNQQNDETCLHDSDGQIRVLLYANGHCPDCETLLRKLLERASEVADQPVTFVSLLTEGSNDAHGHPQEITLAFLKQWSEKFHDAHGQLPKNLLVAASPEDAGTVFYELPDVPRVPGVAIVDTDQTLAYLAQSPKVDSIIAQIKKLKPAAANPTPAHPAPTNPTPTHPAPASPVPPTHSPH